MSGKIVAGVVIVLAAIAGVAIYYLQVYGYYYEVTPEPGRDVTLMPVDGDAPQVIAYDAFRAIDADSSPIRYRSCFTTTLTRAELDAAYVRLDKGEPLVAPGWFDCFDAKAIGQGIEAGEVALYLSVKNIAYGVDRIVGILPDGRGFAWHELNNCGHKAYDGTVVGEECPPAPGSQPGS